MNPNQLPSYSSASPQGGPSKNRLLLVAALAVVVIIILAALTIFKKPGGGLGSSLSISGTNPDVTEVSTQTDSMTVTFNQPLQAGSASVTSSPQIVTANKISDNTLTLTFAPKTLRASTKYTVTIKSISSSTGAQLTNQDLSFTPALAEPTISGENALSDIGLSTDQVHNVVTDVAQFNPWAKEVIINESTIRHFRLNPTDAWSPWAVSFSMSIDGTSYNVVASYFDIEHIQVKISDPATNQQLFTAGDQGSI